MARCKKRTERDASLNKTQLKRMSCEREERRKILANRLCEKREMIAARKRRLFVARSERLRSTKLSSSNTGSSLTTPVGKISIVSSDYITRGSKKSLLRSATVLKRRKKILVASTTPITQRNKPKYSLSTERVRKHRQQLGPDGWARKRAGDAAYNQKQKEQGLNKSVNNLSRRAAKELRRQWCERSMRYRQKKKQSECTEARNTCISNDANPLQLNVGLNQVKQHFKSKKKFLAARLRSTQKKLENVTKQMERYKKIAYRISGYDHQSLQKPSPRARINRLLRNCLVTSSVRRALLFGEVLQTTLRDARRKMKTRQNRLVYHQLFSGKMLSKYKLVSDAKHLISYKQYRQRRLQCGLKLSYMPASRSDAISTVRKASVRQFMEQDINSRMCPGKKDKKTIKKTVFQKRTLLASLKNLHRDYCEDRANPTMSYVSFCRHRPRWIIQPRPSDRETCMCTKHANIQLLVDRLYNLNIIEVNRADDICPYVVCNTHSKACMNKKCSECVAKDIGISLPEDLREDSVQFFEWKSRTECRVVKNRSINVKLMEKCIVVTTKADLADRLKSAIPGFLVHVFTIREQYSALKYKKEHLGRDEIILHCDFAENFILKYHEEIQSMHFGASKRQMSMHTGVLYSRQTTSSAIDDMPVPVSTQPFCTVSGTLDHGVHGIWAHLRPILHLIKEKHASVTKIHFWSDGPTSQYKNRSNLFMMTSILPEMNSNIKLATWNYSEAGHGKGAMDGIGGLLKRTADRLVAQRQDISTVQQFIDKVGPNCPGVSLYEIPPQHFDQIREWMPTDIPSVPSIMSAHQVVWSKQDTPALYLRELSCFECPAICLHHHIGKGVVQTLSSTSLKEFPLRILL